MSSRSTSPRLPTFGIRGLAGPSNPPGLISISRRQYDSTIKSQPDASLLYLDDDDGELITVGSSLELSQRLEEPVPKYSRVYFSEAYSPCDGKLVHVFDIKRSSGSLAEWKDHEAYSSKTLRRQSLESSPVSTISNALPSALFDRHFSEASNFPNLNHKSIEHSSAHSPSPHSVPESKEEATHDSCRFCSHVFSNKDVRDRHECLMHSECIPKRPMTASSAIPTAALEDDSDRQVTGTIEAVNILDGIEKHLHGLANVLQIAATTFQKAASKTRETDTSVVEDILVGVKNILSEVGSFGTAALQELNHQVDDQAAEATIGCDEDQATTVVTRAEVSENSAAQSENLETKSLQQSQLEPKAKLEASVIDGKQAEQYAETNSIPPWESFIPFSTWPVPVGSTPLNPIMVEDDSSSESGSSKKVSFSDEKRANQVNNPSILDDSSEDADFTARYPPLSSVRRARSTIEHSEKNRFYIPYRPKMEPKDVADTSKPFFPPLRLEHPQSPVVAVNVKEQEKPEATESSHKPLPGAWPDVKNDPVPALPVYAESSGAFFNRMTGRNQVGGQNKHGLHRANTTASSNPASRLNGPFDPGFPYEPKTTPPWLNTNDFRLHKYAASPLRNPQNHVSTHSVQSEKFRDLPKLDVKRSVPDFARSAHPRNLNLNFPTSGGASSNGDTHAGYSKYESHRAVKHHRSVPHFQPYAPHPFPPLNTHGSQFSRPSLPRYNPDAESSHTQPWRRTHNPLVAIPFNEPYKKLPSVGQGASPSFSSIPSTPYAPQLKPSDPPVSSISSNMSTARQSPVFPISSTQHNNQQGNRSTSSFHSVTGSPPLRSKMPWEQNTQCFNGSDVHRTSPFSSAPFSQPSVALPVTLPPCPSLMAPPFPPRTFERVTSDRNTQGPIKTDEDRLSDCVEKLAMCGFGIDDDHLKNRLHVYAAAANGDVEEAVEMIEEDRRCNAGL